MGQELGVEGSTRNESSTARQVESEGVWCLLFRFQKRALRGGGVSCVIYKKKLPHDSITEAYQKQKIELQAEIASQNTRQDNLLYRYSYNIAISNVLVVSFLRLVDKRG